MASAPATAMGKANKEVKKLHYGNVLKLFN